MGSSVSVIVVNWNGERFLDKCLSAIMNQTVPAQEVIVLDNASTDSSLEILQKYSSVNLLKKDQNLGFAQGNNIAIAASVESDWIALINPDVFVEPQWIEKLLQATERYPEFDIFGCKLINASNPDILDGVGDVYHLSGRVWRLGHGQSVSSMPGKIEEIFSPCAAAAIYRRSAFLEVGGFDADYFCYVEDIDLCFRLRLAGYRSLYIPHCIAHHIGSATTGGQHSDFAAYYGHRNLVWTYVKNMPGWLFWACLPIHLAMNFLSILALVFRGQGKVVVRAKRDALLGLSKIWKKRRKIQKSRIASINDIWRVLNKCLIPKVK